MSINEAERTRFSTNATELVHRLAEPALIIGADRVIVEANSLVDQLFGWEDEGLTGQIIDVLIPPSVSESHPDWIRMFFAHQLLAPWVKTR